MSNSYAQQGPVTCPHCKQNFTIEVWIVIDADERPDLVQRIRMGNLHMFPCSRCGASFAVEVPILLYQPTKLPPVLYSPAQNMTPGETAQMSNLVDNFRRQPGVAWNASWWPNPVYTVSRQLLPEAVDHFDDVLRRTADAQKDMIDQAKRQFNDWQQRENNTLNDRQLAEMETILQVLSQPARSMGELPRRVQLCEQALEFTRRASNSTQVVPGASESGALQLDVVQRFANPALRAWLQVELGNALSENPQGDRAENLERAISAFEGALKVRTRDAVPQEWAMTQINLGNAYSERVQGNRAENLERAISAFEGALEIVYFSQPEQWALTKTNLGDTYRLRVEGSHEENLERAIAAIEDALTIFTIEAFPEKWAVTQNNLGNVYRDRVMGSREENLEQSIAAYQAALTVFTREALPDRWAITQFNLGNVYADRVAGDHVNNLEQAIKFYEASLAVFIPPTFSQHRGMVQANIEAVKKQLAAISNTKNPPAVPTTVPASSLTIVRGNWEGPFPFHTTFEVTADGKIHNFQSSGAMGPFKYNIQINEDISIKTDRSFSCTTTTSSGKTTLTGQFKNDEEVSGNIQLGITSVQWAAQTIGLTPAMRNKGICAVLRGHIGHVAGVAWSPDGKMLASASGDGTVRLWDAIRAQTLKTLQGHTMYVYSVAWSPDGTILASGSQDMTIRLWNAQGIQILPPLQGHLRDVTSVAFSSDCTTLASGSADGTVRLWNARSGQSLRTLLGHTAAVSSVAWSPDGKMLTSASIDKTVRLWNATSGQSIRVLQGLNTAAVLSIDWSPDARTIASGGADGTVRLWDATTGVNFRILQGHTAAVLSIDWSPDARTIASGSEDRSVRLWDAASGQPPRVLQGHNDEVYCVTWSPDGKMLASGSRDTKMLLWDVRPL